MESRVIKTIFFASFVWLAGVFLPQNALGADTVVYAIQIGSQTLGTLDLNTGVFTQISTRPSPNPKLPCMVASFMEQAHATA